MDELEIKEITTPTARKEILELLALSWSVGMDRFHNYLTDEKFCEQNGISLEILKAIKELNQKLLFSKDYNFPGDQ